MSIHLSIFTPVGQPFSGQVSQVSLPGSGGRFQIYPHHAPMVSSLQAGEMAYTAQGAHHRLAIDGGFVAVATNRVRVVCCPHPKPVRGDQNKP